MPWLPRALPNLSTTLAADPGASGTTLEVASGAGASFGTYFPIDIVVGDPNTAGAWETMTITALSSTDHFTVVRGVAGTAAAHDVGSTVIVSPTAHAYELIRKRLDYGDIALHLHLESNGTDSSPHGHTPTAYGSPTFGSGGKFGNCVTLDGSTQYITYPSSPVFDIGTYGSDWWMSSWVYWASEPDAVRRILSRSVDIVTTGDWAWGIGPHNGNVKINFGYYSPVDTAIVDVYSSALTVSTGTWYHTAVACISGTFLLYFNGSLVGSAGATSYAHRFNANKPMVVGARVQSNNVPCELWAGKLDEIILCRGTYGPFGGATYDIPTCTHG